MASTGATDIDNSRKIWVRLRVTNHTFETSAEMCELLNDNDFDVRGAALGTPTTGDNVPTAFVVSQSTTDKS